MTASNQYLSFIEREQDKRLKRKHTIRMNILLANKLSSTDLLVKLKEKQRRNLDSRYGA